MICRLCISTYLKSDFTLYSLVDVFRDANLNRKNESTKYYVRENARVKNRGRYWYSKKIRRKFESFVRNYLSCIYIFFFVKFSTLLSQLSRVVEKPRRRISRVVFTRHSHCIHFFPFRYIVTENVLKKKWFSHFFLFSRGFTLYFFFSFKMRIKAKLFSLQNIISGNDRDTCKGHRARPTSFFDLPFGLISWRMILSDLLHTYSNKIKTKCDHGRVIQQSCNPDLCVGT